MADYGLKYYCDYRSPMRGTLLYRIDIEERGSTNTDESAAEMLRPYSDVFTIKQGGSDDAEYTAIKGSTVTLKILCVDDMKYLSLFTTDPRKYRLTIYEYRDDSQGSPVKLILWRGFLAANSYKEEFAKPPYIVTLSATDGLSLLTAIPFRNANGEKFAGLKSVYDLLSDALEVLELDMPLCEWTNLNGNISDTPSLKEVYIDTARIYDATKDPNWCDVLKLGSESFIGQVFQAGGVFHVRRIASLRSASRPELFSSNWSLLGKPRPVVHELWRKSTDVSDGSEISMLPPYKLAKVEYSLNNEKVDNERHYEPSRWISGWDYPKISTGNKYLRILKNRVVLYTRKVSTSPQFYFGIGEFKPQENISLNISFDIYNPSNDQIGTWFTIAYGSSWSAEVSTGEREMAYGGKTIDPSGVSNVSDYYPLSGLQYQSVSFTVSSIPNINTGSKWLILKIGSSKTVQAGEMRPEKLFISNIKIDLDATTKITEFNAIELPINNKTPDKCSWSTPIRDGGYNTNPLAGMPNVLTDSTGEPIVSWISRAERGNLMSVVADDIRMLRSNVSRQLDGELRCPDGVDLNSLFFDGKFTNAVYYINSLELLAQRQIYKVQLRELFNTKIVAAINAWTTLCSFNNGARIMASLNGVLFLRSIGNTPVLSLFNTETHDIITLPYTAGPDVRKGVGAVVIPVGETDLYAIDNVGNVLSHLDSTTADILDYESALYDADREIWISCKQMPGMKTSITVLTANLELESQETFDFWKSSIMLTANSYVVSGYTSTDKILRWHNYELHPSGSLADVSSAGIGTNRNPHTISAISDALLIKYYSNDLSFEVCRRYGTMIQSKSICAVPSFGGNYMSSCNNKLAAIYSSSSKQLYICKASGSFRTLDCDADSIIVSVDAVYTTLNGVLSCYSLEDRFLVPRYRTQRVLGTAQGKIIVTNDSARAIDLREMI